MTPLGRRLQRRIAKTGPITIAEYMAECLLDPTHGYYTTRDPLGRAGDFTTAPEISQMFGELIGLWLAQCWMEQGRPDHFVLAELGPGRGTLMADILRATAAVPGFLAASRLHLVEASPALRAAQAQRLAEHRPVWHDRVDTLPNEPVFLLANEFFDALPIRQFQRDPRGWRERVIGLEGDDLRMGLSNPAPLADLEHRLHDTRPGDIVETRRPAAPIVTALAERIADHGGAALIIDYGGWRSLGDTFQALRDHRHEPVLVHPGEADLTAHVDFEALAKAGSPPAAVSPMVAQGVFLERLGIVARSQRLASQLSGDALDAHVAAHRRLTHPDEMGTLFQVIAIHDPRHPTPPGLAA